MKKAVFSGVLFFILFAAVYFILCFLIPGLRIKLEAPPAKYFFVSITHMWFIKTLLSLPASVIAATVPWFIPRN